MSKKLGPRFFGGKSSELSQATRDVIDSEVDELLNSSLNRAREVLSKHHKELKLLAEALLFYETLSRDQVRDILDGKIKIPKGPRPLNPGPPSSPIPLATPVSQEAACKQNNL